MPIMKFLLPLVAIALGLSQIAPAAPRTCRFVYPERPADAPKTAYLFDGKKSRLIGLPSMNLSEIVSLPSGELTILMTPEEVEDIETLPPTAPRLIIPETVGECVVIVSPDPENPTLPVRLILLNTGGGKLKLGETMWFNLTEHRIAAKLGEAKVSIDPKGQAVSTPAMAQSGYYRAEFIFQPQGKGDFQRITEQSWWHDAKGKQLGFVVDTGGRLPGIYTFIDLRPGEEAAAAEPAAE